MTPVENAGATFKSAEVKWLWMGMLPAGTTKTVIYEVKVPPDAGGVYEITGNVSAYGVSPIAVGGESEVVVEVITVERDISPQKAPPGGTISVTVNITPKRDIFAPILDENPPEGWEVTPVENAGATFKPAEVKWLWTEMLPAGTTKKVIYEVKVPSDAEEGIYVITGNVSAHEVSPTPIGVDEIEVIAVVLASISSDPTDVSLMPDESQQLTITAVYTDGSTKDVTEEASYESSNPSVATVSDLGLVTAVAEGSATITISYTEAEITKKTTVPVTVMDWNPWNDPDSEEGEAITDTEILEAIYCWLTDTPAPETGAKLTDENILELVYLWLTG